MTPGRLAVPTVLALFALVCGLGPAHAADAPDDTGAGTAAVKAPRDAVETATREAELWLGEIDAGKYSQSWTEAAEVLKGDISEDEWKAQFIKMHDAVGKVIMREQTSAVYSTRIRGAPTGEYVTIAYLTKYEKIPALVETLAIARGTDGKWRVVGIDLSKALDAMENTVKP